MKLSDVRKDLESYAADVLDRKRRKLEKRRWVMFPFWAIMRLVRKYARVKAKLDPVCRS